MEKVQDKLDFSCAAGIVTFNPDLVKLKRNILSLLKQASLTEIIVVDNHSDNFDEIVQLLRKFKIKIIRNKDNFGIATALNIIMETAYRSNIGWVLTCDQDSIVPDNLMVDFLEYTDISNLAVLCPKIFDMNTKIVLNDDNGTEIEDVDECITSGSLNNVQMWKQINGFDDFLFIDSVDFDYCRRLKEAGLRIIQINKVILKHEIGNMKLVNIFGIKVLVLNHNAFRKYYINRNRVYCDYKEFEKLKLVSILFFLKSILFIFLFENNKIKKIKATVNGFRDGINSGRQLLRGKSNVR